MIIHQLNFFHHQKDEYFLIDNEISFRAISTAGEIMTVYICNVCDLYILDDEEGDPNTGIKPNTPLDSIPDSWRCPVCGATKEALVEVGEKDIKTVKKKYSEHLSKSKSVSKASKDAGNNLTLADVRAKATEKLTGICSVNKVCDGDPSRLCMGQKYGQPIGLGGAGKGLAFTANVKALDKVKLKQRLITPHHEPELAIMFFEQELSMPIMASSLSGVKASMGGSIAEKEFAKAVLTGCMEMDTIGWIGNTSDDGQETTGVEMVKKVGMGIPIFKPQKNDRLIELINMAEEAGALAVGVDLDGVGSTNWERAGKPGYRKSMDELKELVDSTDLPFITKSIMSVDDALDAVDAGVAGIDVSNHGGRILDSTLGVADVLPEIVTAVKGDVIITAGGGVRTGYDVLKMLALGADGVLIGRDIVRAVLGGGAEGVKLHLKYLVSDLRRGMLLTGCNTIKDIDERILDTMLD
jgi:isopentenyl diphosphate isomerase/L-lactate dehydrogenase-like FMN-dependent dehydrogenase/rubredoxin